MARHVDGSSNAGEAMTYEEAGQDDNLVELLREAQQRADQAERSLARAQGSLAMTVGQLVVDAGQSPRRLATLPFTLLRIRRSRRAQRARQPKPSRELVMLQPRDLSLSINAERILLPRRVVVTDTRPSLVVIGPQAFVDALRAVAHVSVAVPHDAAALVRSLDPDAVVVHAHAGAPGTPWYPLGEPGEARRESLLVDVREVCHRLGRPIVLLRDRVHAPGLDPFAETCDLVIELDHEPAQTDVATLLGAIGALTSRDSHP